MRSLIVIEVEHGEDTDAITDFIETISKSDDYRSDEQWLESFGFDFKVVDSSPVVDIPSHITATAIAGILS